MKRKRFFYYSDFAFKQVEDNYVLTFKETVSDAITKSSFTISKIGTTPTIELRDFN